MAPIKDSANPSMQICAGSRTPSGKPTPGRRLTAQLKGELSSTKLGAASRGAGSPCCAAGDGRQQLPGASSARHAREQLEPEARSEIAVPGMQGHLAGYQPASPVVGAGQGAAGTGCFPCREHDFPSRKMAALCRGQGLFLLCCIPTASLPGDFAGTETQAVAPDVGSRGLWVPFAFAPVGWQQRGVWRYL